jgi:hypothetical protein
MYCKKKYETVNEIMNKAYILKYTLYITKIQSDN